MATNTERRPGWDTPRQFSERHNTGVNYPYELAKSGVLSGLYVRLGGRLFIRDDALEVLAERQAEADGK